MLKKSKNVLVIIDMQNDFITGSLANKDAEKIIPNIIKEIESDKYDQIIFTCDTHDKEYLNTLEGEHLPVEHCIEGTEGWNIHKDLYSKNAVYILKETFGSKTLAEFLEKFAKTVTLCGTCTDICVISNALILKSYCPDIPVKVLYNCCAGTSPEANNQAMNVMQNCQIDII